MCIALLGTDAHIDMLVVVPLSTCNSGNGAELDNHTTYIPGGPFAHNMLQNNCKSHYQQLKLYRNSSNITGGPINIIITITVIRQHFAWVVLWVISTNWLA